MMKAMTLAAFAAIFALVAYASGSDAAGHLYAAGSARYLFISDNHMTEAKMFFCISVMATVGATALFITAVKVLRAIRAEACAWAYAERTMEDMAPYWKGLELRQSGYTSYRYYLVVERGFLPHQVDQLWEKRWANK